jgi:hypothetical protein
MILGAFHFHNPNLDTAQFRGIDVRTPQRQQEIEALVDDLARFRPTRVALEIRVSEGDGQETRPSPRGPEIQQEYQAYRAGEFAITSANEVYQLGFRLAGRLNHEEVYPVDFGLALDIPELMAYAAEHDREFAGWFQDYIADATRQIDGMQQTGTINQNLRWMNDPETLALAQAGYARMAAVGAGDSYIGARVATQWYERNIHIFGNLSRLAAPGERILLIVGQGHAPILRQLVEDHPALELVEPNDYLR